MATQTERVTAILAAARSWKSGALTTPQFRRAVRVAISPAFGARP